MIYCFLSAIQCTMYHVVLNRQYKGYPNFNDESHALWTNMFRQIIQIMSIYHNHIGWRAESEFQCLDVYIRYQMKTNSMGHTVNYILSLDQPKPHAFPSQSLHVAVFTCDPTAPPPVITCGWPMIYSCFRHMLLLQLHTSHLPRPPTLTSYYMQLALDT